MNKFDNIRGEKLLMFILGWENVDNVLNYPTIFNVGGQKVFAQMKCYQIIKWWLNIFYLTSYRITNSLRILIGF